MLVFSSHPPSAWISGLALFWRVLLPWLLIVVEVVQISTSLTLSLPFLPPIIYIFLSISTHPNLERGAFSLLTYSHLNEFILNLIILLLCSSKPPTTYMYFCCSVRKEVMLEKNELNNDYFCYTIEMSQFLASMCMLLLLEYFYLC